MLGHDTHGHAETTTTGCTGALADRRRGVSHGGNVFGVVSATYEDGGAGGVPSLTTVDQHQIRQKHQEVEFVVKQSGTNLGTAPMAAAGLHWQPQQRRLAPAQRPVQPGEHRSG